MGILLLLILTTLASSYELYDIYVETDKYCRHSPDNSWIVTGTTGSFIYTQAASLVPGAVNRLSVNTSTTLGDLVSVEPYFKYYECTVVDVEVHAGDDNNPWTYHNEDAPKAPCWNKGKGTRPYDGNCYSDADETGGVVGLPLSVLNDWTGVGNIAAPASAPNPPTGSRPNTNGFSVYGAGWLEFLVRDLVDVERDANGMPVANENGEFINIRTGWLDLDLIYGTDEKNPPLLKGDGRGLLNRTTVWAKFTNAPEEVKIIVQEVIDYHDYANYLYDMFDLHEYNKSDASWHANPRARFEIARELNILHYQTQAYESLSALWGVNAFPAFLFTYFYENPSRKLGTFPVTAAIDWFQTMHADIPAIYAEYPNECPQQQLQAVKNTPAPGFGSAPLDVEAYNLAHNFSIALGVPYHNTWLCEFSKMFLGGTCEGFDDSDALFTKAHHDDTCVPDEYGETCQPLEVMAYGDLFTVLPDVYWSPYNSEPFFTNFPPVFLANTAALIYQALQDEPRKYEEIYSIYTGAVSYDIGGSQSIYPYYFTHIEACDAGAKYPGMHYGFGPTQYLYSYPGVYATSFCSSFYNQFTWKYWAGGNVHWPADMMYYAYPNPGVEWPMFRRNVIGGIATCFKQKIDPENCQCPPPCYHACNCTDTGFC